MKIRIVKVLFIALTLVFTGCATNYKPIYPKNVKYNATDVHDGIDFAYRYGILKERGNNRYAKKEYKKNIKIIAIRITNNTDSIINVERNIEFYSGQNKVFPMLPLVIKNQLRQIVPSYFPYALFTFMNFYVTNGNSVKVYPIGLVLGPALSIGNIATAATANKRMLDELNMYNVLNKNIQKGETVYGIIGIREMGYNPITIKLKK